MTYSKKKKLIITIAVGLLYSCASPLHEGLDLGKPASINNATPAAQEFSGEGVNITATPLKNAVELGEPIYIAIYVTNKGTEPVKIIGSLKPDNPLVDIYSSAKGKEPVILAPMGDMDSAGSIDLGPGQTTGDIAPIFFGANGWNFTQPGTYRISVVVRVPVEKGFARFRSSEAVIEVKPSEAGKELFSMEKLDTYQAGKFLLWRSGDHLENGIKALREISKRYPSAVLTTYITAARAHNLSKPFANYIIGKVRLPDCKQADRLRKTMDMGILSENLQIQEYISRARCHAERKQWNEAMQALKTGAGLTKEQPEFIGYRKTIMMMQERLQRYQN